MWGECLELVWEPLAEDANGKMLTNIVNDGKVHAGYADVCVFNEQ